MVHWPAVLGREWRIFRRELAPEGVLVLTDCQMILISEEKARPWYKLENGRKYGYIVTYYPLARVNAMQLSEHGPLNTINLDLRARGFGGKLTIDFPCGQKAAISALLDQAASSPAFAPSRLRSGFG